MPESFDGYGWIKVKKHEFDSSKSWEENYKALEAHHVEETKFLIETVRRVAGSPPETKKATPERACEICGAKFFYGKDEWFNWFYCRECCGKRKIRLFLTNKLSQWTMSDFWIDGVRYNCCEQYMMAEKARLFKDEETLKKIMDVDNLNVAFAHFKDWREFPREQKRLGREVKGFDKEQWEKVAQDVVYRGNYAKFSQNPDLWNFLDETDKDHLAEANPKDPIWGIGLGRDDPRAQDISQWQGKNWLGLALMKVRAKIREEKEAKEAERILKECEKNYDPTKKLDGSWLE